jgi:hypothetical protein
MTCLSALARAKLLFRIGLLSLLFAGFSPGTSAAPSTVTLAWDASTDSTVMGYNVYYGVASQNYTNILDAGNGTLLPVPNLVPGTTYYFAATTYNAVGLESDFSVETSYTIPASTDNRPPTLDPPADLTINEDSGLRTVTLTGISSGAVQENQVLSLTALSGNSSIIPDPTVTYTSPNSTATLTFTPVSGAYGSASITVMVDDGGVVSNTIIRSFTVNVLPVNDPPTLAPLSNLSLDENAEAQVVNLSGITAGTGETQSLTVTAASSNPGLIPDPTVTYTSPNTAGTLAFAPLTNAYGWTRITVTVNDGQPTNNLFTQSFIVNVRQTDSGTNATPAPAWTLWWQSTNGATAQWKMEGTNQVAGGRLNVLPASPGWRLAGQADFNGDGQVDLLWQDAQGTAALWLMDQTTNCLSRVRIGSGPAGTAWRIGGVGDLNGDGMPDILWQSTSGATAVWLMNGTNVTSKMRLNAPPASDGWVLAGTGDFDGDTHLDLLWQHTTGYTAVWLMDGTNCTSHFRLSAPPADPGWRIVGVTSLQTSQHPDIIWQHANGSLAYWLMDTTNRVGLGRLNPGHVDPAWRVSGPR